MIGRKCSVEGCDRKFYGRGLCKGHYQRWWATGSVGDASFRPVSEGFWERVDKSGDCWLWQKANVDGYGVLHIDGRRVRAHRYSYELTYGPIPSGLHVLHHCDNPPCVNPAHLWLGTPADNVKDMVSKGRQGRPNPKLRPDDIPAIRADARKYADIATDFGVSKSLIGMVKRGKVWRDVA